MSTFKAIREYLQLTQQAMADALECSQGNVSFYEKGQSVPVPMAERLIDVVGAKGIRLTLDHVYGREPLPWLAKPKRRATEQQGA